MTLYYAYWQRNATTGSTRVALRAGMTQPSTSAASSTRTTETNVTGSVGATPTRELESARIAAMASGTPEHQADQQRMQPLPEHKCQNVARCAAHGDPQANFLGTAIHRMPITE